MSSWISLYFQSIEAQLSDKHRPAGLDLNCPRSLRHRDAGHHGLDSAAQRRGQSCGSERDERRIAPRRLPRRASITFASYSATVDEIVRVNEILTQNWCRLQLAVVTRIHLESYLLQEPAVRIDTTTTP